MPDALANQMRSLTPKGGTSIGDRAMFAPPRDRVPGFIQGGSKTAWNELISPKLLGHDRRSNGAIYRANEAKWSLEAAEEPAEKITTRRTHAESLRGLGKPAECFLRSRVPLTRQNRRRDETNQMRSELEIRPQLLWRGHR